MPNATLLIKPVSGMCNMRCGYCFYADVSSRRRVASYGVMSHETLETVVRRAFNYAEDKCSFAFQGGEPTLAGLDFFESFVKIQREYNYRNITVSNCIQTNGYKLGEEWADFFIKHKFLVGLSIDGTEDLHDGYRRGPSGEGTYAQAVETAEMFARRGVEFNILCVVNNAVAGRPADVYAALRGYKYVQFNPCLDGFEEAAQLGAGGAKSPYSLGAAEYARFLNLTFDEYYRDYMNGEFVSVRNFDNYIGMLFGRQPEQCGMIGECTCYFLVEADGGVFPCDFYVLDEWKIGNVHSGSFAKMLKTPAARNFIEISRQVDEDCRECRWGVLCRGGCRRYREPYADGILPKNRFCAAYKDFFEHSYDKMIKIAKKSNT